MLTSSSAEEKFSVAVVHGSTVPSCRGSLVVLLLLCAFCDSAFSSCASRRLLHKQ